MHEQARAQITISWVVIHHCYQLTYISVFVDGHYDRVNSNFPISVMPINVERQSMKYVVIPQILKLVKLEFL